jgi:integrase
MARNKLTETKVKASRPGWLGDGDGLWLRTSKAGSRSWVFVSIRHGRRKELGLGPFGSGARHVSLAAARNKAEQVRAILGAGGDPASDLPERQAKLKCRTFGEVADELLASKDQVFRNEKHKAQWSMTLTVYAKPLRRLPVEEVKTDDVVSVLRPLWHEKPETASRLRGRIEKVLDLAKALGLRDGENPARWTGHLDHILGGRRRLTRGHHAALPYNEVPAFMARLGHVPGLGARALEFTILTAARSGETLNARWSEFDLEAGLWTVPAERMKAGRPHSVPLPDRAIDLLQALPRLSEWTFPGQAPRRPLSNMAMTAVLRRLDVKVTTHGFRSSFRDWAGDQTTFSRDVAEAALAHLVGDETERAYRRGDALRKRRELMKAWEDYCSKVPAK